MAALDGRNYKKAYVNVPSERADIGSVGGSVVCLWDDSVGETPVATDTLNIGKLPKGAKIISVVSVGLGGAGAAVNVTPAELTTDEKIVIATVGAAPTLPITVMVTYTVA